MLQCTSVPYIFWEKGWSGERGVLKWISTSDFSRLLTQGLGIRRPKYLLQTTFWGNCACLKWHSVLITWNDNIPLRCSDLNLLSFFSLDSSHRTACDLRLPTITTTSLVQLFSSHFLEWYKILQLYSFINTFKITTRYRKVRTYPEAPPGSISEFDMPLRWQNKFQLQLCGIGFSCRIRG